MACLCSAIQPEVRLVVVDKLRTRKVLSAERQGLPAIIVKPSGMRPMPSETHVLRRRRRSEVLLHALNVD